MLSVIERVENAIKSLQTGQAIILTDNPGRENEGDLIFPAETIDAGMMNFIIRHTSGIVCLSILPAQMEKLQLRFMVPPSENTSIRETPFTVSIDAREGISTGVSAADRVKTILTAVNPNAAPEDLDKPGHIFPLCAKPNGVLERAGHTEGSVDIIRLAGFSEAAVLCELMNPDGTMMRGKDLDTFADKHKLSILSIDDIIAYRLLKENLISEEITTNLVLKKYGNFKLTVIKERMSEGEHTILEHSRPSDQAILVRVHSSCLTGDLFGSTRCDCYDQLHYSLDRISCEGGILIYLNQEGRGIGLLNKIKAYALQDEGYDTIEANEQLGLPADSRNYAIAANILRNRGISKIRLLTNNPHKMLELTKYGIDEVTRVALPTFCDDNNKKYLQTKKKKLNHFIHDI